MSRSIAFACLAALLAVTAPALAQTSEEGSDEPKKLYDEDAETQPEPEDTYDGGYRFGLGFAAGLNKVDEDNEVMFLANARIGKKNRTSHVTSFLEIEASYWNRDEALRSPDSDLLVGVNGILMLPAEAADFFFGAGIGLHYLDGVLDVSTLEKDSEAHVGGNVQFGLDFNLGDAASLWGAGRIDFIEGDSEVVDTLQPKVLIGVRFKL